MINVLKWIKNLFVKKQTCLPEPTKIVYKDERAEFLNSIKVSTKNKISKKKGILKGIICEGDGTGFGKISV